jgi:general secretion pathway protein A
VYEKFYCLRENPFSLTPDPEFIFLNKNYKAALDQVLYAIRRREGFTVIVGDVGTGKTTLCWALLARLGDELQTALVLNPMLSAEDMLRAILQDFGIKRRHVHTDESSGGEPPREGSDWMQGLSRKELIDELNYFLLCRAEEDVFCVLIIDEAQDLSLDVLEQLRLLSNLETSKKKLLQIIFVGQIEFIQKLKSNELRSLNQRISIRYELKPLSPEETVQYIAHRLRVARANPNLDFTRGALNEVYKFSRGYPRLVNLICDRALLAGFNERAWTITGRMVRDEARKLRGTTKTPGQPAIWRSQMVPALTIILIALVSLVILYAVRNIMSSGSAAQVPPQTRQEVVQPSTPAEVTPPAAAATPEPVPPVAARFAAAEPPQEQPKAEPSATQFATPSETFSVQVHSLPSEEKAAAAVKELETLGFKAYSRPQGQGMKKYTVLAGPFDQKGAEQCLAALRSYHISHPFIIRSTE